MSAAIAHNVNLKARCRTKHVYTQTHHAPSQLSWQALIVLSSLGTSAAETIMVGKLSWLTLRPCKAIAKPATCAVSNAALERLKSTTMPTSWDTATGNLLKLFDPAWR